MPRRRVVQLLLTAAALDAAVFVARSHAQADAIPMTDVPDLRTALYAGDTAKADQAAQRLLTRPDPAARAALRDALADFGKAPVQLAAARALAGNPTEDASLVTPLFALLTPTSGRELLDSAGRALTAFKGNAGVQSQLLALANGRDERVRLVAIRTLGTFVDQGVAAALVGFTDPASGQPGTVVRESGSALSYLTGLPATTDWRAWWETNRNKAPAQFTADLSHDRAVRYDLSRSRFDGLQTEFVRLLNTLYDQTPENERADLLLRHLKSNDAVVRTAACALAKQAADRGVRSTAITEQLRALVGDASPDVRRGAAIALTPINDPKAVVPLLVQLNQETETTVRAALATALRPTQDVRAVPALVTLLNDPSSDTAQTAADALVEVTAGLRKSDPAAADNTALRIRDAIKARTTPTTNIELRAALVDTLGRLQSPIVAADLVAMLNGPNEHRVVRRALLAAVGGYHDPRYTELLVGWMNDMSDAQTRLAAVRAVGESKPEFSFVQEALAARIDPANEKDHADVRDAAWRVLTTAFATAPTKQLEAWESKPILRNDAAKRIVVLRELKKRAVAEGDISTAAGRSGQIGNAAFELYRYADAVDAYKDAFDQTVAIKGNVETICDKLIDSYLRNKQFPQAIDFMQKMVQQDRNFQVLGTRFKYEVERLIKDGDYTTATQLIELSLRMNPALAPKFQSDLRDFATTVKARTNQQNQSLTPDDPTQTAFEVHGGVRRPA